MDYYLIPIIIGLAMDVVGALMIIGPMREYKKIKSNYRDEENRLYEDMDELESGKFNPSSSEQNFERIDRIEETLRDLNRSKEDEFPRIFNGVMILIVGFILQGAGAGWQLIDSMI